LTCGRTETVSAGGSKTTQHVSSYSYDDIYQLTQVVLDGNVSEAYTYDAALYRVLMTDHECRVFPLIF
jgi:YD repeat-containing protein